MPTTEERHLLDYGLLKSRCSSHSQVIGQMERVRRDDDISYYFQMRAFKFPGESDVYFFCSVDISADYNFPELCPRRARFSRMLREHPDGVTEVKLYDNVKVLLSEKLKPEPVKGQSFCNFIAVRQLIVYEV